MRLLGITNCFPRSHDDTRAPWNRQQMLALSATNDIRLIVPVPFTQARVQTLQPQLTWSAENNFRAFYPTFWFTPRCFQQHYGRQMLWSIQATVDRILKDFTPDAVLGCWAHPDGYAAVEIARQLGVPALVKVVGTDVLILGKSKKRRSRIANALQRADGVLAVSRDLANHVIEMGVDSEKVHIIPEGIDTNLFRAGNQSEARRKLGLNTRQRMILFVGNLLLSKGAGVLIQACGLLRDRSVDFTCHLIGSGPDEAHLRQLAAQLGLGDRVVFAGRRSHGNLPDWYRSADVVALPSFSEGIPNTLREAMCCGRPFVATCVGGIPEISPPEFTRLVPPGDVASLAAAISEMLDQPPKVDLEMVSKYCVSWEESAGRINDVLHRLTPAANTDLLHDVTLRQKSLEPIAI